nr:uncharacterized protein LOC129423990 isoform X2 [Misgurnus anguillicaudatus]
MQLGKVRKNKGLLACFTRIIVLCSPPSSTKQFHVNSNTQNPGMKHCHEHAKPTDGDIFLNPEKPLQSRLAMNKEKVRELTSQASVVQVIGTAVSQHNLLACTSRMRPIQMRFTPMPANRQWKTRASTSPPTLPQAFQITTYNCSPFMRPDAMLGSPGPPSPGMYTLHQV